MSGSTALGLRAAAYAALAESAARATIFTHADRRYVAKAPGLGRGWLQAWFVKLFCRFVLHCPVPLAPLRLVNGQARLEHEATRLSILAAAGVSVPQVMLLEPGCLVLEYVGCTVEETLHPLPHARYGEILFPALDDLRRFHAAGHWHGGAQIKNLTLQDGRLYRIDLEEDVGAYLPLPLMQAFDLVLFVNSCTLLCNMSETDSLALATTLFRRYLQTPSEPLVYDTLAKGRRSLDSACTLLAPLRQRGGRSLRRVFILRDALGAALEG
jgi:tRNA A-37 threonylcarbamoyl transferase component Bud32